MVKIQSQLEAEQYLASLNLSLADVSIWVDELYSIYTFDLEKKGLDGLAEAKFIRTLRQELSTYETLLQGRYRNEEKFQRDLDRDPDSGYSHRTLEYVPEIQMERILRVPNSWSYQDVRGEIQTFIVCEKCLWINNMSDHGIEESGRVNPCVVCENCKVHDFVWLKEWKFGKREEKGRGNWNWTSWWDREDQDDKKGKVKPLVESRGPMKSEPLTPGIKVFDWRTRSYTD